jgi:hypothetical protein
VRERRHGEGFKKGSRIESREGKIQKNEGKIIKEDGEREREG